MGLRRREGKESLDDGFLWRGAHWLCAKEAGEPGFDPGRFAMPSIIQVETLRGQLVVCIWDSREKDRNVR